MSEIEKIGEMETKTPYEWCLESKVRVLDLNEWPLEWHGSKERHFFEFEWIGKGEFLDALKLCRVKYNSTPRKTPMYLEYRMYGMVPYNLSGIQKGIQYGHAVVEYGLAARGLQGPEDIFWKWAKYDKTFIILNGGTTNENKDGKWYGSLQKHRDAIQELGIPYAEFHEPDLNDTLTGFVFLVDERVYDRELYPDFVEEKPEWKLRKNEKHLAEVAERNEKNYIKWVEKIGGPNNAFLRTHLRPLSLA